MRRSQFVRLGLELLESPSTWVMTQATYQAQLSIRETPVETKTSYPFPEVDWGSCTNKVGRAVPFKTSARVVR